MNSFTVRPLAAAEWESFRRLRLTALETSPGVFSGAYEGAIKRPDDAWRSLVSGPGHQVFGLFGGRNLVGITGVFASKEDPTGETAMLAMSYISVEFRGLGLSRLLYEARLDWIKAHGQFTRVLVSHRESNEVSRRANQRHGFVLTHKKERKWPDGATETEVFYELKLK